MRQFQVSENRSVEEGARARGQTKQKTLSISRTIVSLFLRFEIFFLFFHTIFFFFETCDGKFLFRNQRCNMQKRGRMRPVFFLFFLLERENGFFLSSSFSPKNLLFHVVVRLLPFIRQDGDHVLTRNPGIVMHRAAAADAPEGATVVVGGGSDGVVVGGAARALIRVGISIGQPLQQRAERSALWRRGPDERRRFRPAGPRRGAARAAPPRAPGPSWPSRATRGPRSGLVSLSPRPSCRRRRSPRRSGRRRRRQRPWPRGRRRACSRCVPRAAATRRPRAEGGDCGALARRPCRVVGRYHF